MIIYLLNYDTNHGSREEWNIFYTPVEVFSTEEKREERINELKVSLDDDGEPNGYEFHKTECTLDEPS